ncbi:MAG: hypothetical protein ACK412_04620 [Chloroherpetonaceae bacterium]
MTISKQLPKFFLLLAVSFATALYLFSLKGGFGNVLVQPLVLYPTLLSPVSFSFYIFALLFAGMLGLSLFQFFPKQRTNKRLARSRIYLTAGMLLFGIWLMAWCYNLLFASAISAMLLVATLARASMNLELRTAANIGEVWLLRAPVMLFFGWATFLAVVNWATLFQSLKWKLKWLSPDAWAILLMITLALFSLWICFRYLDLFFITAVVWGFIGIALKKGVSLPVSRAAWLSIFVMALIVLIKAPRKLLEET